MDKEEAILTLRKNKLDMEHDELLQDRNLIVATEVGFPITLINIAIAIKLDTSLLPLTILTSLIFMGLVEWARRQNKTKIVDKRNEINAFIRKLEKEIRNK